MRLTLSLSPENEVLALPIHYNRLVQGLIYSLLEEEVAGFIHDTGFTRGRRSFRLFTFSRLMGRYAIDRAGGNIAFTGDVRLVISSPYAEFVDSLGQVILNSQRLRLGRDYVRLQSVKADEHTVETDEIVVRTLSPITAYSTVERPDGSSFTYYFEPREGEFGRLLGHNLVRKMEAFTGQTFEADDSFRLVALTRPCKLCIVRYAGGVIKGYTGHFHLAGDRRLLQMGLDAGFGAKNSQGFGLCELA